jgi:hypothetical protein
MRNKVHKVNQNDKRLSEALRRMAALAPQGAPPSLKEMLHDEFRRHHALRRRKQITQISSFAAVLAACLAMAFVFWPRATNIVARKEIVPTMPQPHKPASAGQAESKLPKPNVRIQNHRMRVKTRKSSPAPSDRFVVLPTFDAAIPIDHLEMVRLNLPGRDLRLVGFPVSEEIAERRVLADVLVAPDGTPYALRFVQSSNTKEHLQ